MGDLSKHFSRKEFVCHDCDQDTVDYELISVLETVRSMFNAPITINSGNRCFVHNQRTGGSPNSQRMKGKAADIVVKGIAPQVVYDYLDMTFPDKYGIGLYKTSGFVHIDVRANKSRF